MSSKLKRKITVDKPKDSSDPPRRPSVFERLGPGALNLPLSSQDRPSRAEQNEKCRNWLRTGSCTYGNTCRYQHDPYTGSKRPSKPEKESDKKDVRHKAKKHSKEDVAKEARTSISPKRKSSKSSSSHSRKGEHESKIKSTVVISRPRSLPQPSTTTEPTDEKKKKADGGTWEDDSEDWPMDAAQLDYKEELTLERKRQQLQRELEMEIQKEKMMHGNASYTDSSSSSSSSDSGSASSSSDSSSSSSDEDSDDSSSSSTSTSSSASQAPPKKKYKKATTKKLPLPKTTDSAVHKKPVDDYDKIKNRHSSKSTSRLHSPVSRDTPKKKTRDRRNRSPSPTRSKNRSNLDEGKSDSHHVRKGPRTPSPPHPSRKQRQWGESSSADSRSADFHRNRGKRHKKNKDSNEKPSDHAPIPPPRLSSPNRTLLLPHGPPGKKPWPRDDNRKNRPHSPPMLPHRKRSLSPRRTEDGKDRKNNDRKSEALPHDNRKDGHYRSNEQAGYGKKDEWKGKRTSPPDGKKGRDDKQKDRGNNKERMADPDTWSDDHKKGADSRSSRLEPSSSSLSSKNDRSRDRDRKKGKDRDLLPLRDDLDRSRLSPPMRMSDVHAHHSLRDDPPLISIARGHLYEPDPPPDDRDYAYGYPPHHDTPYLDDRVLPPDYDQDLLPPLYPPPETGSYPPVGYGESRYRRDIALKEPPSHMERIVGYRGRELPPLDPRDTVLLPPRDEDYLADIPLDERRGFDERWSRSRPIRDDWDPYSTLGAASLPPHVTATLDEDRYGMPRRVRNRTSPDWHMRRGNERDIAIRDPRSRSPPPHRRMDDNPPLPPIRPWRDQMDRGRNSDHLNDPQLKQNQDDRKNRNNNRRDRREYVKRQEDVHPSENISKTSTLSKSRDKPGNKRSRSNTPLKKDAKKRKEDTSVKSEGSSSDKGARKTSNDQKTDAKSSSKSKSSAKTTKTRSASPKPEEKLSSEKAVVKEKVSEKSDGSTKSSKGSSKPENDEKKHRSGDKNGKAHANDEFSDWSDGDDDILNRDLAEKSGSSKRSVFSQSESSTSEKSRNKVDDSHNKKDKTNSDSLESKERSKDKKRKRDGSRDSKTHSRDPNSESRSRTGSKESSSKQDSIIHSAKESDSLEAFVVKDETVDDMDDLMMTESVDYDPISDGELDALIEEPDDTLLKTESTEESKGIVDALNINWSDLVSESKPKYIPGNARKRFTAVHILSKMGFSTALAGPELTEMIKKHCQEQLDKDIDEEEEVKELKKEGEKQDVGNKEQKKFKIEHSFAVFHEIMAKQAKIRQHAFSYMGPYRRALCARRDLDIRKMLCRPQSKIVIPPSSCGNKETPKDKKKTENPPVAIEATCGPEL